MADIDRDERVTRAYRALGEESPPAALDQAILAASRRRGGRWAVPVSAAAVLVLAVAVAVVVERESPKEVDEVAVAPQAIAPPAREVPKKAADAEPRLAESRAKAEDRAAAGKVRPDALAKRGERQSAEPTSQPASPVAAPAPAPAEATPAPRAVAGAVMGSAAGVAETPAHWLERIAKLREAGLQKEADEALAEFRRRNPDYEIPKEMRARVERR